MCIYAQTPVYVTLVTIDIKIYVHTYIYIWHIYIDLHTYIWHHMTYIYIHIYVTYNYVYIMRGCQYRYTNPQRTWVYHSKTWYFKQRPSATHATTGDNHRSCSHQHLATFRNKVSVHIYIHIHQNIYILVCIHTTYINIHKTLHISRWHIFQDATPADSASSWHRFWRGAAGTPVISWFIKAIKTSINYTILIFTMKTSINHT